MSDIGRRADGGKRGSRHSVAEAAAILGVSDRAVRARIERGTLRAERAGKRSWVVWLPEPSGTGNGNGNGIPIPVAAKNGTAPERPSGEAGDLSKLVQLPGDKDQRILELAGQVGYLQSQLSETRKALPDSQCRRWWRFW
jgi:excisionase family DNA binding protein